MPLQDLLNISGSRQKIGLSEERVNAILPEAGKYIGFWREYPDLFVDFMVRGTRTEVKEGEFKFYFYQRVFLRAVMRHQYMYAVFPRAWFRANPEIFCFRGQTSLIKGTLFSNYIKGILR